MVRQSFLRGAVLFAIILVALLLCLDVAYLMSGSLEQAPTVEQEHKVRLVTAALGALLLATGAGLWVAYRRLAAK